VKGSYLILGKNHQKETGRLIPEAPADLAIHGTSDIESLKIHCFNIKIKLALL
jgi:hypothetical protein